MNTRHSKFGMRAAAAGVRHSRFVTRHPQRQRGSVLVLVIAVLMLMLLVGTAYIQSARLDRLSTAQLNQNHIDQVESGELGRIMFHLKADLVDPDTGAFLDNGVYTVTNAAGTYDHTREPYDYPHEKVDPWLAGIAPNNSGNWLHLTDLTEGDAGLAVVASPDFGDGTTGFRASAYTGTTPIDNGNGRFDADGDGIEDSIFIEADTPWIGGNYYVAAVRIIDLAALININVATASRDDRSSPNFVTSQLNQSPRWRYPSELDLSLLLRTSRSRITNTVFRATLGYKFGQNSLAAPRPWGTGDSRNEFWLHGPRLYNNFNGDGAGTTYQPLGMPTELILRRKNGLNSPDDIASPLQTEAMLLAGLRDKLPTAGSPESPNTNPPTNDLEHSFADAGTGQSISQFFDYSDTIRNSCFEIRKFLTTSSATAIFAPDLAGGVGARTQLDLNTATADQISARIKEVYDNNTPTLPSHLNSPQEFADQFAACIVDYRDADNKLTRVGDEWGLEALPYVTEAYVQHNYQVTASTDLGGTPKKWQVTWARKGSSCIIEVRNPFKRTISIENVSLQVDTATVNLSDSGVTELAPEEYILVYHQVGETGDIGDPLVAQGIDGAAAGTVDLGANPWDGNTTRFNVDLIVKDSDDNDVTYQRARIWNVDTPDAPVSASPLEYTNSPDPDVDPMDKWGYRHRSSIGNANGINAMLVQSAQFAATAVNYTDNTIPEDHDPGIDGLGDKDKSTYGGPADQLDPAQHQLLLRDAPDERIWQVGELAHILIIGPDANVSASAGVIDAQWGSERDSTKYMLDLDEKTELYDTTDGPFKLPHAMVLLDQFTTLAPNTDGEDNDGDGSTDEADEVVVPGRINLNTAPDTVLYRALPLPIDNAARETLIDAILAYRDDDPTTRSDYRNTADDVGIASFAELWRVPEMQTSLTDVSGDGYATVNGANVRIDYMPNPSAVTGAADDDEVTGDREETARLTRWLGQLCTTRSDVFAAYVVLRGYTGGVFQDADGNPVAPDEQVRFVAILDRSGVLDSDGRVKVIGLLRY